MSKPKITQADMDQLTPTFKHLTDEENYIMAHRCAMKLGIMQRIKLCVALLEPDCYHDSSKLSKAVTLLKSILTRE